MKKMILATLVLAMTGCAQMNNHQNQTSQYLTQNQPVQLVNCLGDKLNVSFINNRPYSNGAPMSVENFYHNSSWMVAYLQRHPENELLMKNWLMAETKKGGVHGQQAYYVMGHSGLIYDNKTYSADYYLQTRKIFTTGLQTYCQTLNAQGYNPYAQTNQFNQSSYYVQQQQQYLAQQQALLAQQQYHNQQQAMLQQQYYNQQPYYYQQPVQKPSLIQSIFQSIRR